MKKELWDKERLKIKGGVIEIEYQTGMTKGQINRKAEYNIIILKYPFAIGNHIVCEDIIGEQSFYHYRRIKSIKILNNT